MKHGGYPVMDLEMLVYCPLMEDVSEDVTGWDKATIDYVSRNKSKVYNQIRGIAKTLRKKNLQATDIDDIYEEVLIYLYNCDDYNLSKAVERSSSGTIVSLEGYLNVCIKFCVMRYCTSMFKEEKEIIHEVVNPDSDDKELCLLDNIADVRSSEHIETILYDLESICKSCEPLRYKYGPDIYLILYIRLLTLNCKDSPELYKDILNILGISKKELNAIEKLSVEDELMTSFVKAIDITGVKRAIEIIRPYVYSAKRIEDTILAYA